MITPTSAISLQISWTEPSIPNGVIRRYGVYQVTMDTNQLVGDFASETGSLTVTGLLPFTEYRYFLEVCTAAGCSNSEIVAVRTLEGGE